MLTAAHALQPIMCSSILFDTQPVSLSYVVRYVTYMLLCPQGFALAVKMGVTKQQLDSLVGIHPTAGEEVIGLKGPARLVIVANDAAAAQTDPAGKQQTADGAAKTRR